MNYKDQQIGYQQTNKGTKSPLRYMSHGKNQITKITPVWDWEAGVWSKDGQEARRWEVALYQVVCHLFLFLYFLFAFLFHILSSYIVGGDPLSGRMSPDSFNFVFHTSHFLFSISFSISCFIVGVGPLSGHMSPVWYFVFWLSFFGILNGVFWILDNI